VTRDPEQEARATHERAGHCSFCGKSRDAVKGLVAAGNTPGVAICDECVGLAVEFFNEQPKK
jgi:transcription elongation factor Elf1